VGGVIPVHLRRWAAWAPGHEDAAAWRGWCAAPRPLPAEGCPEAAFLPAMLRRRCSPLTRIVLSVAFGCCEEQERARVASVFASRHGNINESIELLERLALEQPLSPTRFSHSVHNAQAGLFSIAAGNRQASSSIAAETETFGCAFLEALTFLERAPERPVLLVMADVPLAPVFAALIDEPAASYGLGLLLASDGPGTRLGFGIAAGGAGAQHGRWPEALEFLRWLESPEPRLALGAGPRRFEWARSA
jgi:hypothetical protein